MEAIFLKILNMSITASWLVLAIVILRLILKKAPKAISVFMWALVGVRLICPFSFESILSLIPSAETIPQEIIYSEAPAIHSGVPIFNSTVNPIISENLAPEVGASVNPMQVIAFIASVVWIVGIAAMVLYTVVSYFRIHRKVREAVPYQDNIWLCDHIDTPFILGVIRPRIYLPSNMSGQDIEYVIAHEKAHLKRHDHWWKPLGFLLLTVYWFNPILWIAYILLCKDIELACDEKVIKDMGTEIKKPYSEALINCSVPRKMISACPLAFGEVGVKGRVKSVLNYKKPAFWIIVVAVVACIALSVGFLTNPTTKLDTNMASFIEEQIIEHHHGGYKSGEFYCTDFKVLGTEKDKENTTVYMWVLYSEYDKVNGKIEDVSGAHIPTVITVKKTGSSKYELVEYWEPRDGSYYAEDIKDKFPWYLHGKALDSQRYIKDQQAFCENAAKEYFKDADEYVGGPTNIGELKAKYPQFFNISTDGGLTVYIWQMAKNSYYCYLANTSLEAVSDNSFVYEVGATIAEMRAILTTYDIDRKDITVQPVINPLSSYYYEIDDEYRTRIKEMFWSSNVNNLEFEVEKTDDWGISVGMLFTSATEFDIVINQSSEKQIAAGTYTTSPEYELRAIYNGSAIPFGDYMRAVLNKEYDDPELTWDTVLYYVKPDKELKIYGNFSTTYGELPVGQYELWKPITLTTEDGTQSQKVYTVQFAITD